MSPPAVFFQHSKAPGGRTGRGGEEGWAKGEGRSTGGRDGVGRGARGGDGESGGCGDRDNGGSRCKRVKLAAGAARGSSG